MPYFVRHFRIITFVLVLVCALMLSWVFFIGVSANQRGGFYNKGHNAVWLGHEWVGEEKTAQEIQGLVHTLKAHQIDTVFVHAGPFKPDGSIDPDRYRYSIDFLENARRFDDTIRYQAWLGQLRSKVNLEEKSVRKDMVNQAMILTRMVGFDGIHYDIEPVWDQDTAFIELLKETRMAITSEKLLSVALAEFIPQSVLWLSEGLHEFTLYNSEVNYRNVAQYADQIVAMVYDTGISQDWLYQWLVKEQTIWVSRLFDDEVEVFLGIPAYDTATAAFNPTVENVENGLIGIVAGLNNLRTNKHSFAGVALYPYWFIDDEEWRVYRELWLE